MKKHGDLRRYLIRKNIFNIARPLIWYAFFIYVAAKYIIFGKYDVNVRNFVTWFVGIVILILPFLEGWVKKAICDVNFTGRVEKLTIEHLSKPKHAALKGGWRIAEHFRLLKFVLIGENGRKRKFSIYCPSFVDTNYIKVGDTVRHHRGSDYLEKINKAGDTDVLCIACGSMNRMDHDVCLECRRSLLKGTAYYEEK